VESESASPARGSPSECWRRRRTRTARTERRGTGPGNSIRTEVRTAASDHRSVSAWVHHSSNSCNRPGRVGSSTCPDRGHSSASGSMWAHWCESEYVWRRSNRPHSRLGCTREPHRRCRSAA
jgi:hypothetical protein